MRKRATEKKRGGGKSLQELLQKIRQDVNSTREQLDRLIQTMAQTDERIRDGKDSVSDSLLRDRQLKEQLDEAIERLMKAEILLNRNFETEEME